MQHMTERDWNMVFDELLEALYDARVDVEFGPIDEATFEAVGARALKRQHVALDSEDGKSLMALAWEQVNAM